MKSITIKTGRKVNLYFVSDTHLGSKCFKKEKFKKLIEKIKKDSYAKVILLGDLIDGIHSSDRRFSIDELSQEYQSIEDQIIGIKDLLRPIKNKIIGAVSGNHEHTIKRNSGIDVTNLICDEFDSEYLGYSGLIKIVVGDEVFRVLVHHGKGSSKTLGGQVRVMKRMVSNMDKVPDVVAVGHFHQLDSILDVKLNDDLNSVPKYLILTGGFFDTYGDPEQENYASKKFYSPTPIGCMMMELNKNGSIKDNKIVYNLNR